MAIRSRELVQFLSRIGLSKVAFHLALPKVKTVLTVDPSQQMANVSNDKLGLSSVLSKAADIAPIQRPKTRTGDGPGSPPQSLQRHLRNHSLSGIHRKTKIPEALACSHVNRAWPDPYPGTRARNPTPTPNPNLLKPQPPNPKPNPKPQTQNPKPKPPNPNPQTRTPKPEPPNPNHKPEPPNPNPRPPPAKKPAGGQGSPHSK